MENLSKLFRLRILKNLKKVGAGHIASSLSCIDILIAILIKEKKEEDTFILSKGHAAMALYVTLNHLGEISDEILDTYYTDGTILPAHPPPGKFKSIPFALGTLGHGFPIAVGIALANSLNNHNYYTYVLMSDGDTNEGTTWEAMHFAVKHKLEKLIVIIDKNRLQGFGSSVDILGDTAKKLIWDKIGFEVNEVDGHKITEIQRAISNLKNSTTARPKLVIANTTKGKGVSFMENKMEWHYLPMNEEQYVQALSDINNFYA